MAYNYTFYPTPNSNNTGDLLEIFTWVNNSATDGLFFPLIILAIWAIQFIGVMASGRPASRAWLFASFTATILSIILGILALMEQKWIYLLVIFVSLGAFWIKLSRSKN